MFIPTAFCDKMERTFGNKISNDDVHHLKYYLKMLFNSVAFNIYTINFDHVFSLNTFILVLKKIKCFNDAKSLFVS